MRRCPVGDRGAHAPDANQSQSSSHTGPGQPKGRRGGGHWAVAGKESPGVLGRRGQAGREPVTGKWQEEGAEARSSP